MYFIVSMSADFNSESTGGICRKSQGFITCTSNTWDKKHKYFVNIFQESKSHYRTIAKTRTYMKDGQVVTSTTTKVIATGEENRVREEHLHR